MRVMLPKSDRSFRVAPGQTVLDAALDAGLDVPHSCKGGNCGACRARLIDGGVSYPNGAPLGLAASEVADGLILLCQARAQSDLSIEIFDVRTPDEIRARRLPCRIERTQRWSHDVMGVYLRLPAAERFEFLPGQYIDILLSKGRRRSFSIASPPHDARPLELHVRLAPGGEFTEQLFAGTMSLLEIEGPLGQFAYRTSLPPADARAPVDVAPPGRASPPGNAGTPADSRAPADARVPADAGAPPPPPMLLVGGGTGLAPLMSIIRHVIENDLPRSMTLFWGVRAERDLYAHAILEEISRRDARLRYFPVLSQHSPAWTGLTGLVHEAVLGNFEGLERHEVYASGPPQMIEAVRREFGLRGVEGSRLFCDSFDYAPDSAARQRKSAASKS